MNKIFNLSMNKTATCSTNALLKACGINSVQNSEESALSLAEKFDAINDGHHVKIFKSYYESYPNALFLLNTRPLEDWICSRFKHGLAQARSTRKEKPNWAWPASEKMALNWVNGRRYHHHSVLDFFRDKPSQLLVCNIDNPVWQKAILKFLKVDKEIPPIVANTRQIQNNNIQNVMNNLKNNASYNQNELLFPDFDPINYSMLQMYL